MKYTYVHDLHLLDVVDGLHLDFAHGHERVVEDVVAEEAAVVQVHLVRNHEVEDVVGALVGRLVGHAGLLQKVSLNVPAGHPTLGVEPDANELSLFDKNGRVEPGFLKTILSCLSYSGTFEVACFFVLSSRCYAAIASFEL